jgi:hypothetical protein
MWRAAALAVRNVVRAAVSSGAISGGERGEMRRDQGGFIERHPLLLTAVTAKPPDGCTRVARGLPIAKK